MVFFKLAIIISLCTTVAFADCPISDNPKQIVECLRYLSSGLYGAAINDVKIICDVAVDVIRCAQKELGECVAAEIGRAALKEISSLAENCCPTVNHTKCPIRNGLFSGQRCFASDSFVTLADGKQKQISELQSGDFVLAYNDQTKEVVSTPVITILHNQPTELAIFKHLTTVSGQQLSLTSNHLLLTDKHEYIMAKNIHAGANIVIINDKGALVSETVSDVIDIVKQGYIAPLTREGTIIVNNVAASCYATINSHRIAHAALAPMRWWYSWFGKEQVSNEIIGLHWFPKMLYEITAFLMPSILHQ